MHSLWLISEALHFKKPLAELKLVFPQSTLKRNNDSCVFEEKNANANDSLVENCIFTDQKECRFRSYEENPLLIGTMFKVRNRQANRQPN